MGGGVSGWVTKRDGEIRTWMRAEKEGRAGEGRRWRGCL